MPVSTCFPHWKANWTVLPVAMLPVSNDLSGGVAVRYCASLSGLAGFHVVQDILHGATVGKGTHMHLLHLSLLLSLPLSTLLGVLKED